MKEVGGGATMKNGTPYTYEDPLIRRIIKSEGLRWAQHVARISNSEVPMRIINGNPGQHRRGQPEVRWLDNVQKI